MLTWLGKNEWLNYLKLRNTLRSTEFIPSPDDHVAVGTHGRTSPSGDVFCHLDQCVLIIRVGLRDRPSQDNTLWDAGASIAFHTEGWGDQTPLWAAA